MIAQIYNGDSMKKIILTVMVAFALFGCSSSSDETAAVEPKLVVNKSLSGLTLQDQHEKTQKLQADTRIVFFSFSKPTGHACNEFLENKPANFLAEHKAVYIADVSAAPSLIKKMFILPDLKELKFPILLINDDTLSAAYSKGVDKEKIVVVLLDNGVIKEIKNLNDTKALENFFAKN